MASGISYRHKLLFVHIPRTGGTSIAYTMQDIFGKPHRGVPTHRRIEDFEVNPSEYFKFAVIRNPWAMVASWYQWHIYHNAPQVEMETAAYAVEKPRSFGLERMDYVLRYKTLEQDFKKLWQKLELPRMKLRKMNVGLNGMDYRRLYSDTARMIVAGRFAWEIERYGYTFDA